MYHIKEDKRAQKSAQLISEGLIRCMKQKEFRKITISDIQRESTVGRATFYRLFDNLYDVLYYQCECLAMEMEQTYGIGKHTEGKSFLEYSFHYWIRHHDFLEALFNCDRSDILQRVMLAHMNDFKKLLRLNKVSERELEYFIPMATAMLSSTLITWVRNGMNENSDELFTIFHETIRITYQMFEL